MTVIIITIATSTRPSEHIIPSYVAQAEIMSCSAYFAAVVYRIFAKFIQSVQLGQFCGLF